MTVGCGDGEKGNYGSKFHIRKYVTIAGESMMEEKVTIEGESRREEKATTEKGTPMENDTKKGG